jgi:hypothetical protein
MKSFSDYIKKRNHLIVSEMAYDPMTWKNEDGTEETVEEIRKAPIFFDKDDIEYLYQFPPQYWSSALQKRYGILLQKAYEAEQSGSKFNDIQDVVVGRVKGGKDVAFRVDTNINELLDRITSDVDDVKLSQLRLKSPDTGSSGRDEYIKHLEEKKKEGKRYGAHGFVLKNWKRDGGVSTAEGYVEQDQKTIAKRLGSLYQAIEDGWLDKDIEETDPEALKNKRRINFSGGGERNLPVFQAGAPSARNSLADTDSEVKVWVTTSGKKIRGYLPILKPAFMVDTSAVESHNFAKTAQQQVDSDLRSDDGLREYYSIIDINSPNLINMKKLAEVVAKINKTQVEIKKLPPQSNERQQKQRTLGRLYALGVIAEFLGNVNLGIRSRNEKLLRRLGYKKVSAEDMERAISQLGPIKSKVADKLKSQLKKAAAGENPEQESIKVVRNFIERIKNYFSTRASVIKDTATRYDVHQWNIKHHSKDERKGHTDLTGFGTMNPNKQQKERVHGSMKQTFESDAQANEFWDHLLNEKQIRQSVINGIDRKIDSMPADPVSNAIRYALTQPSNKEMLDRLAIRYFQRKGNVKAVTAYAQLYVEGETDSRKARALVAKIAEQGSRQGNNYCQSLLQLHRRFQTRVFPKVRATRQENPNDISLESVFRRFYEEHIDIHAKQSHEIGVLYNKMLDGSTAPIEKERIKKEIITKIEQQVAKDAEKVSSETRSSLDASAGDVSEADKQLAQNVVSVGLAHLSKSIVSSVKSTFLGIRSIFSKRPTTLATPPAAPPQTATKSKEPEANTPASTKAPTDPAAIKPATAKNPEGIRSFMGRFFGKKQ